MEVARTSMIHAAAPHFLWPFAVRYAAHQLKLWPRVSLPETSSTLRWAGEVGDASVFRVWGSRTFVRDMSTNKLSARAIPCVFLCFVPDAPSWQFYHPTSRRVLPSHDVTFDESVPFYRLFPYCSAPPPPRPLFLALGPPPDDPLLPQGPAPSGVSQIDPLSGTAPVEVAVGLGAAPCATSGGAASRGAEPGGAGSKGAGSGGAGPWGEEAGGAEPEGAEPGGAESEGAESGGAEPRGAASSEGPAGASPRLSPQQLREWLVWRACLWSGAPGAGGARDAGAGGAGVTAGAGGTGGTATLRSLEPLELEALALVELALGGTGAGGAGATGVGAVDPRAGGAGGTVRPRPYFVPLLQKVLGVPSSTGLTPPILCPPPDHSQPRGLTERREPVSRPVLPVHTACRAPCSCPPPVPSTHTMALRPSSVPLRVPLPAPPESSLPKRDYELHSLDFSTAFLQGSLHEEIWLRRQPGFTAGTQWSLRRPVYGLHQAPCEWHDTLRTTIAALGFAPATADPTLSLRTDTSLPLFYILVYVDDLVFATADTEALTLVKSELQKRYICTDLGELRSYLGLQITRERARHTISLTQSHMVHQVLQRFGFQFSSPQPTPLSTSHSL
ncbi:unnamed protein product [Closterium sp. NIES-54]